MKTFSNAAETLVVWNDRAGTAPQAATLRKQLESEPGVRVVETSSKEEAHRLAAEASGETALIVAAGGDGTVSAVVNGLFSRGDQLQLAVLPLGTGNDLCRSLHIPLDPIRAWEVIKLQRERRIDVLRGETPAVTRIVTNSLSGGNSSRLLQCVTAERKRVWGAWSYLRCAIEVFSDLESFRMKLTLDEDPQVEYHAWNVIMANAPTAGGGVPIAPRANLEDGFVDVIVIRDGSPLDAAAVAAEFVLGDYLEDERVIFRRVRQATFESDPPIKMVADGEQLTGQPLHLCVIPRALRVVVGPDYTGLG